MKVIQEKRMESLVLAKTLRLRMNVSVEPVWDLSDGPVKIELGGGIDQPEEFYYLTSVRAYKS